MNRIKFTVLALAASALSVAAFAQTPNDVIEKFNAAAELVNNKDYAGAIPVLNQTVEMGLDVGPEAMETVTSAQKLLPVCYFRVALGQAQAQDFDNAIENLQKAADLGELYGDMNTSRNASGMISKVYTIMAANAFNDKDYATAAEIFAKGYEANPTDTDLALNLAMSYSEMGEKEKGLDVYKEIISLEDRHSKYAEPAQAAKEKVSYYVMLDAAAAIEAKESDNAIAILEEGLEIVPADPAMNMMLIQTATNAQKWDKIIERGEAAAEAQVTPELTSDAYFFLGAAYQNKENKAKAIENYRKVTAGGNMATARAQISALNN